MVLRETYQKFFIFALICLVAMPNILHARHRRKHHVAVSEISVPSASAFSGFACTQAKFIKDGELDDDKNYYVWESSTSAPFNEVIVSWNALRPRHGNMHFWVSVKLDSWSGWYHLAQWGAKTQKSFSNKTNPNIHAKHVRIELQRGYRARAYRVKVTFDGGAEKENLKALFACLSDLKSFKVARPTMSNQSVIVKGVPKLSQMRLHHPRCHELCSPTSTSIMVNYFLNKQYGSFASSNLLAYAANFAERVHDRGPLDIYGNWLFNVAQAFDAGHGSVFYHVSRLNGFNDLYHYLENEIPVVVSVRRLKGGATPYKNGHLLVVVGWNQNKRSVICVDPAFEASRKTLRAYNIWNFLQAWGLSYNLCYVPLLPNRFNRRDL